MVAAEPLLLSLIKRTQPRASWAHCLHQLGRHVAQPLGSQLWSSDWVLASEVEALLKKINLLVPSCFWGVDMVLLPQDPLICEITW